MNKIFLAGFLAFFYLLLNCAYVQANSINRAETLYLQNNYSDSISECALDISRNNNSERAYYLLGLNYLMLNDTEKAREKFKFLIDNIKSGRYVEQAKLAYADTLFVDQNYQEARINYENLLKEKSPLEPLIYLRLGQCSLKLGDWEKAGNFFNILEKNYPLSLEAKQASQLKGQDKEFFFTVQIGSFANQDNARKLLKKIETQNFSGYIDELNAAGGMLYRVRVGKLKSRKEAEDLKAQLEKEGYPTKIFP